jgi:hypothetical protein
MFKHGFQSPPGGKSHPMIDIMYSLGFPVWSRDGGWTSVNKEQFNKDLIAGKTPAGGMQGAMGAEMASTGMNARSMGGPTRPRGGLMGLNFRLRK